LSIAPDADEAAARHLREEEEPAPAADRRPAGRYLAGHDLQSVSGGFLAQSRDAGQVSAGTLKVVTQRAPTDQEMADLLFAFRVCKHVKSNAIVYAKGGATTGIGAGQMNRARAAASPHGSPMPRRRQPGWTGRWPKDRWWRPTPSSPSRTGWKSPPRPAQLP
jgi:AICAR transformylase/IMP cyclohydrolase PurH